MISMDSSNMVVVKGGKYGIATFAGEEKVTPQFDSLKNIYQNYYIAQKDGIQCLIDSDNNVKIDYIYKSIT